MTQAGGQRSLSGAEAAVIQAVTLQTLLDVLRSDGYLTVGPRLIDGAIIYDEIDSSEDLPRGWTDSQDGGSYRVTRREDAAFFGYNVGPHSWKKYLLPANQLLWRADRKGGDFDILPEPASAEPRKPYAFIGVRACELKAIQVQDQVLLGGRHEDSTYQKARRPAFLVAVNCGQAGGTCFCVSMDAGPRCSDGYDLVLSELLDEDDHRFLIEAGSERGAEVMRKLPGRTARRDDLDRAQALREAASSQMGRKMETEGIKDLLAQSYEHPRWEKVADRCLTCANCTMVCPTCFCTTVEDATDLSGDHAERWRRWDSCFSLDFSYVHGGSLRSSAKSRYRQWLTHKLGTWIDQFGSSGCVGCGRCITWCPVGIDLTEEIRALQDGKAL